MFVAPVTTTGACSIKLYLILDFQDIEIFSTCFKSLSTREQSQYPFIRGYRKNKAKLKLFNGGPCLNKVELE